MRPATVPPLRLPAGDAGAPRGCGGSPSRRRSRRAGHQGRPRCRSIKATASAKVSAAALRPTSSRAERAPSAVGVLWDFPGTSGPIKRHEHETAERSFAQLSDHTPLIAAGHRVQWSLPGQLTIGSWQLRAERRTPSAPHRYTPPREGLTCPTSRLTHHQNERQMSVKMPRRASFQRQDIARNAHSAHNAHHPNPQVRHPLRQVQGSPRTPHDASWRNTHRHST